MVMLNKVIRKSVSLLTCMLAVAVTPTYVLLLCSAFQCNQRNHDYEQAFIANQQSESGKCGGSSTDEAEDASKSTKAKVDQADDTWEQTRDKKVTELLIENPCDQEREETHLSNISSLGNISSLSNISSMEKTEEKTDNTTKKVSKEGNRRATIDHKAPMTLEQTKEEVNRKKLENKNLEQVVASNIPLQSIITQHPFKDDVSLLSLFESLSVRFSGPNCVQSCNENLRESIKWYQGNEDCEKSLTRPIPLLDKHSETQRNKK